MHDIVWDWPVFLSQLFGFAVIVWVLVKWVVPPLSTAMAKAQNVVRAQLVDSERAANRVVAAAEADEAAMAQIAIAARHLEHDAHTDAVHILAESRAAAEAEALRQHSSGHARLARLRTELTRELRTTLHTAVLTRTEQQVRTHFTAPRAKTAATDRFLDELEAMR
ncbi:F0F1 ATP synthase subunit B family protein [Nocardia brasiliensis]|uniref:F0F1 ATP synthase subunit B family protein n=1 Tax=Nocardia brasiliensis TaxID=37326 RepID=UPI0033FE9DE7